MVFIRDVLNEINNSVHPEQLLEKLSYAGFKSDEVERFQNEGYQVYKGKVRELLARDGVLQIYHTDRLSAFDRYVGLVPFKGVILAKISEFWLKKAEAIMPVHLLDAPHSRVLRGEQLDPIKVEVIVRGFMTGSMQRAYLKGEREFCGERLPEGLTPSCKLGAPIITPTTKAAVFEHDENISPQELIDRGVCSRKEWEEIVDMAFKLFAMGQHVYSDVGWILVDTKYEFGRTKNGTIKLIDEIHTPDSSRLWVADTYEDRVAHGESPEMLDKEIIRRYLMDRGFSGEGDVPSVPACKFVELSEVYLKVAEKLIGHSLAV